MIVALIDNGSLEPGAHLNLRAVAAELSKRTGISVHPVSWKHSDRIPVEQLAVDPAASEASAPAWTLAPFIRAMTALGQREFLFVPFFISAQGAIGSALRRDLEKLQEELPLQPFEFSFTPGLAASGVIPEIVAQRILATLGTQALPRTTPVMVVDHGGPSPTSAALRNALAAAVGDLLIGKTGPVVAASMEGEEHAHNQPVMADQLATPGFDSGDVVIAPLFLSPGRHAGPEGDLAQIARAAEDRLALGSLRCHFTELVGTHPLAIDTLAHALRDTLSTLQAPTFA
jgi:sirohydrochlorin ferrochelatase